MKKVIFRFNEILDEKEIQKVTKTYNEKNILFMSNSFDLIQIDDETGEIKKI